MKKFTLTVEIKDDGTPYNAEFSRKCTGIDRIAIWAIVKDLAEESLKQILGQKK